MTTIRAHFDGLTIVPDEPVNLPINQPLTLHIDETVEPPAKPTKRMMTGKDLVDSGLFGIWKDRTDIGDSLEYARKLRKQAETRHHEIDDPS
jgi:hypothetical protein